MAPQIDWEAIKAAYLTGHYTFEDVSKIFNVNHNTIMGRAAKEKWAQSKKAMLAPLKSAIMTRVEEASDAKHAKSSKNASENQKEKSLVPLAEERIKDIVPKGPTFRERVAKQTDKVLDHLELQEIATNLQADQFVSILEKTEKVGSRARGLDTETQSSRILVNLSVLQLSDVVPEIGVRDIEVGQLPPETV